MKQQNEWNTFKRSTTLEKLLTFVVIGISIVVACAPVALVLSVIYAVRHFAR